jgi:hypothetical protein
MRKAALATLLAATVLPVSHAAAAPSVSVSVDRKTITTKLGHKFVIHSTITNGSSTSIRGLIAHLNVLSLDGQFYVDPEDWSSHRTRYLQPIAAGGSVRISWRLNAVNAGHLGVYVAVLPRSGAAAAPVTAPIVSVNIADRRTLDSGGILPLALGLPALLGTLTLGVRLVRRRERRVAVTRAEA